MPRGTNRTPRTRLACVNGMLSAVIMIIAYAVVAVAVRATTSVARSILVPLTSPR